MGCRTDEGQSVNDKGSINPLYIDDDRARIDGIPSIQIAHGPSSNEHGALNTKTGTETENKTTTTMMGVPASWKRWIALALACFHTLFSGGVVYGWSRLEKIIEEQGIFQDACEGGLTTMANELKNCTVRKEMIGGVCTFGVWGCNTSTLIFGYVLDRWGSKVCFTLATMVMIFGVLLCMNYESLGEYAIYGGYFFLGFGAPSVAMAVLPIAQLFPGAKALMTNIMVSFFDFSTYVFLVMKLMYFNSSLTWTTLWTIYLTILVLILLTGVIFHPHRYTTVTRELDNNPQRFEEGTGLSGASIPDPNTSSEQQIQHHEEKNQRAMEAMGEAAAHGEKQHSEECPEKEELKSLTLKKQLKSSQWWYCCSFMCIHMTHAFFFQLTVNHQLESHKVDPWYGDLFTVIFPIGGILAIPWNAYLIDYKPEAWAFTYLNLIYLAFGVTSLFLNHPVLRIMCFVLIAFTGQCTFCLFLSYLGQNFGHANFGKHFGLMNICWGIVGLVNPLLLSLSLRLPFLSGDPDVVVNPDFTYVNTFFILLSLPLLQYHHGDTIRRFLRIPKMGLEEGAPTKAKRSSEI